MTRGQEADSCIVGLVAAEDHLALVMALMILGEDGTGD